MLTSAVIPHSTATLSIEIFVTSPKCIAQSASLSSSAASDVDKGQAHDRRYSALYGDPGRRDYRDLAQIY